MAKFCGVASIVLVVIFAPGAAKWQPRTRRRIILGARGAARSGLPSGDINQL